MLGPGVQITIFNDARSFDKQMSSLTFLALVLLAGTITSEARSVGGRSLLASLKTSSSAESNSKDGKASVTTSVRATDGSVVLDAQALSQSLEETRSEFIQIRQTVIREVQDGSPVEAAANTTARAVGKAIAKTYTSVIITAESTASDSELCSEAQSFSEADARAVAEVFLEVFVQAENSEAIADADGTAQALAEANAEAASSATAEACLVGEGKVLAFQESFANAVSTAYATVLVDALGRIDADGARASVVNRANSDTTEDVQVGATSDNEVVGQGTSDSEATANARTGPIDCLELGFDSCCRRSSFLRIDDECRCGVSCILKLQKIEDEGFTFNLKRAPSGVEGLRKNLKCICLAN